MSLIIILAIWMTSLCFSTKLELVLVEILLPHEHKVFSNYMPVSMSELDEEWYSS